jgi:hypothetical protein
MEEKSWEESREKLIVGDGNVYLLELSAGNSGKKGES